MPEVCSTIPVGAVPNGDVLKEAVLIARGQSDVAPNRAHLILLCLQCDVLDEQNGELRALLAELNRQLRDSREIRLTRQAVMQ